MTVNLLKKMAEMTLVTNKMQISTYLAQFKSQIHVILYYIYA